MQYWTHSVFNIDEHLTKKNIRVLSGGEKQKINLLSAFVRDRKVIILDDPTSGLDQKAIKNYKNTFVKLNMTKYTF